MNEDPNSNKKIVSQDLDDRLIEIQEDGSVKVTEIVKTIYTQGYREFLTDVRNMQKFREDVEATLKEDFVKKQQERIEKVTSEIDKLQPYLNDAEKKWLAEQDNQRLKGIVDRVKEELAKAPAEVNKDYMGAVWDNIKSQKLDVLSKLSEEELNKFAKYKLKSLAKSRR